MSLSILMEDNQFFSFMCIPSHTCQRSSFVFKLYLFEGMPKVLEFGLRQITPYVRFNGRFLQPFLETCYAPTHKHSLISASQRPHLRRSTSWVRRISQKSSSRFKLNLFEGMHKALEFGLRSHCSLRPLQRTNPAENLWNELRLHS